MHKYILFLLIGLSISCQKESKEPCDYIEEYYQDVYKAELAYWEKEYDEAYALLKDVESRCTLLNQNAIYEPRLMARLCVKVGKPQDAFPYIERVLKEGMHFDTLQNDPVFEILHEYEEWKYLKSKEADYLLAYRNNLNSDLRNEIMSMNELDQVVRINEARREDMKEIDSLNKKRIKEIFEEYGYPSYDLVGKPRMGERTDIIVMLMHFLEPEYFTPLLLDGARKGIAPPGYVGYVVDRKELAESDKFTYGIYDNADSIEIKDFQNLDKRRIAVGLPPWKLKKKSDSLKKTYYNIN